MFPPQRVSHLQWPQQQQQIMDRHKASRNGVWVSSGRSVSERGRPKLAHRHINLRAVKGATSRVETVLVATAAQRLLQLLLSL